MIEDKQNKNCLLVCHGMGMICTYDTKFVVCFSSFYVFYQIHYNYARLKLRTYRGSSYNEQRKRGQG